ncbi:N-acetylglutamate synthase-like GNAT family acetyltransferase [Psychromicrobium silvestre]|uniref:N-acetylglutamate synthase-like GNAT family acetyltransferase n=1 Tax=Psychromicrobium silvestre TaxID=1645614 RepID=A0A7Y9LSW3_9MICC|nr:N-acetylglutamate synthase-like GNAT family acetyltransferase [Psychromicrobium silvestre]
MIVFRLAQPADYDEVARITRDSYLAAGHFDSAEHPYMQQIQQVAERAEAAQIWVAERAGEVVGAVTLAQKGEPYADIALADELEMRMLVVDPAVQRGGIGKALVAAVIKQARSLDGVQAVSLTTGDSWVSAHALYQSMGFGRVSERDWPVPGTEVWLRVYRLEL